MLSCIHQASQWMAALLSHGATKWTSRYVATKSRLSAVQCFSRVCWALNVLSDCRQYDTYSLRQWNWQADATDQNASNGSNGVCTACFYGIYLRLNLHQMMPVGQFHCPKLCDVYAKPFFIYLSNASTLDNFSNFFVFFHCSDPQKSWHVTFLQLTTFERKGDTAVQAQAKKELLLWQLVLSYHQVKCLTAWQWLTRSLGAQDLKSKKFNRNGNWS